jgi:hypothetical protein
MTTERRRPVMNLGPLLADFVAEVAQERPRLRVVASLGRFSETALGGSLHSIGAGI